MKSLYDKAYTWGIVESGDGGEFVAEPMILMARDKVTSQPTTDTDAEPEVDPGENPKSTEFDQCQHFNFSDLLEQLLVDYQVAVADVKAEASDGEAPKSPATAPLKVEEVFGNAVCNINRFIRTTKQVDKAEIRAFLHRLMMRQAGAVLKPYQPAFDLIIPVYLSDPDAPFDETKLAAFAIQVKNRNERKPWPLDVEAPKGPKGSKAVKAPKTL